MDPVAPGTDQGGLPGEDEGQEVHVPDQLHAQVHRQGLSPLTTSVDILSVDDLVVRYGPIVAVQNVSLSVRQGEIVALLGANGAGKSSLLNAVVGLVPRGGRQRSRSRASRSTALARRRSCATGISLTPEGRRVFPRLTVDDNLRLGGAVTRDRARLRRRLRARARALPDPRRERSAQNGGTLSGGQQQMLAIGRSLMSRPSLLLLDEPSLGLAPIVVDQIFALLERLRSRGHDDPARRAERAPRARDRRPRLRARLGPRREPRGPPPSCAPPADIERAYLGIGVSE